MEVLEGMPVDVDRAALMERLHIEAGSDDALEFDDILAVMLERARPKTGFREAFVEGRGYDTVTVDGVTFTSRVLRGRLGEVERVFPFVATCGTELDEPAVLGLTGGDILTDYWADQIREAVLRDCHRRLDEELKERYALGKTSSMAPGSGDAMVWPIQEQIPLFALLGDVTGSVGVRLTDSCLMLPRKSVSGIVFPTAVDFRTCQLCRREVCRSRAAAFDAAMWERAGMDAMGTRDGDGAGAGRGSGDDHAGVP